MANTSPCCNAELWDLDCDMCEGGGDDTGLGAQCPKCGGDGFISGYRECSDCGDVYEVGDVPERKLRS